MPYCTTDWYVSNRVGIGTDNPGFRLVICDTTVPLIQLKNSSNVGFGVVLEHNGVNSEYWNYENGHIRLGTANAERLRITNTGNIGIGTTSPDATLHVTRNENQDNIGTIRYENANTGTGSSTNAQLLGVSKFGCAQYMVWENYGMRIGMRSIGAVAGGAGELYFTTCNDSTQMVIKNSGNVGIGTTSPNARLHVQGSSGDGTATFRVTSTSAADSFNYAGTIINGCLCSNRNYILLIGQDLSNRNAGYIGYNHTGTTNSNNNFLTFGHYQSDNLLNLLGNGNIGVGTTSPTYKLQVNGTFYAAGSSIKYKEGIRNYNTDSCLFMCLKPVAYQYKDEFKHLGKELKSETQIGLIAEHVAEVMPELAILVNEEDNKVVRNVDYEKLSIVLLAEVQKLRQEVDDLKNK